MPRKKKKQESREVEIASEQVERGDSLTIAEVKKFIEDCRKGRRMDYIDIADRSWDEVEKRNKRGRLYGGSDMYKTRRWTRFPLWWSCWKIRKPIVLARIPEPVLKDTQGDDPYGRTACILGERFIKSVLKTFDAFTEISSAVDDFLVTDFGWGRWFYTTELCYEDEKVRLQVVEPEPMLDEQGQPIPAPPEPPIFLDPRTGEPVMEGILEDEQGAYLLSGQQVEVEDERVFLESQLYAALYVESDTRKWNEVTRCAYEYHYSYRDFIQKFGEAGLQKIAMSEVDEHRTGKPIIVFEYWGKMPKEVRWLAETSDDFLSPQTGLDRDRNIDIPKLEEVDEEISDYDNSDLYGLTGFFPSAEPMVMNNPTKSFWPTPEYFQVADILEDVHGIVSRMFLLTKAIRVRFLYDSSVPQLSSLIGETGEGGGLGIPNLEDNLIRGKGTLATLVQYFPVDEMITGLNNMYTAFEQRLNMFYQITGLSDLLRGQTDPNSDKTYGERQMEGKFALNRIEPYQRKVQEWIKDNYLLGMEMGLKMFSEKTIDEYIVPQTLDQEDKQRYVPSLELLKSNKRRRFRVDFETDSTIAINQGWRREQAIQTANAITKMMESTAKVAQDMPELAATELKLMEHVVGELTDGKLFVDEIRDSIQTSIDKAMQPKPQEPNVDIEKVKLQGQALTADIQFKHLQLQTQTQIEWAKLQQKSQQDSFTNQLKQLEISIANGVSQAELQIAVNKLQSDIAQGWTELNLKKEALLAQVQEVAGKQEMEAMRTMLDARVKNQELTLDEADQQLRQLEVQIMARDSQVSLAERVATERRLQEEHQMDAQAKGIDAAASLLDSMKTEAPKAAPISIDMSRTLQFKEGNKTEKKKEKKKDAKPK